jgi:hypothetical protein
MHGWGGESNGFIPLGRESRQLSCIARRQFVKMTLPRVFEL